MHPNEELARREAEAWAIRTASEEALGMYTDDAVIHYPGRNPLAGAYVGHDGLREFASRIGELVGDGTIRRELHDALGTDEHAVQLLTVEAEVGARRHAWRAAIVMHVRDGKISEAWVTVEDQYALDEFLNTIARG